MNSYASLLAGWVAVLLTLPVGLANADQLFESLEPLEVGISGPLIQVRRERDKLNTYPATLTTQGESFEVELRVRGNKRLDPDTCSFPPLWVGFDSSSIKKTLYAHQKDIKLVVLCKGQDRYRDYLRGEYLIYRMFNLLTPLSYRVRWLNVTYIDEKSKTRSEPAFFIERKSRLAKRNDLKGTDVSSIRHSQLEPVSSALVALFQYIISNADYSMVASNDDDCCHNAKLLIDEQSVYKPIIYDFDSSGLVNARYAIPSPALKIKKVTRRLYRGYCSHNDAVQAAREQILAMGPELLELFEQDVVLSKKARKKMVSYLNESIQIVEDENSWQEEIVGSCRG